MIFLEYERIPSRYEITDGQFIQLLKEWITEYSYAIKTPRRKVIALIEPEKIARNDMLALTECLTSLENAVQLVSFFIIRPFVSQYPFFPVLLVF